MKGHVKANVGEYTVNRKLNQKRKMTANVHRCHLRMKKYDAKA